MKETIDTRLKCIIIKETYSVYEFKPSLLHMFYKNYEPMYFKRWVRFLLELLKGYKVYYLSVDNVIVAYSVVSKGGGRYSFAEKKDIVIGPYFVLEEFRGLRYSELLLSELLKCDKIQYRYAYDWIKNTNIPSIRCTLKVGFMPVATANLVGFKRMIKICTKNDGDYTIYRYRRGEGTRT